MKLGWIDFSKAERNKILDVLELLSERSTLDELGIAPIRDGFANLFFPGTSTIQTRAKYFFIVPYALKDLERNSESNPNRAMSVLDATERECGEAFLKNASDEMGIIGNRSLKAGRWVKRTPADIYWAGLKQYGIFCGGNLSLSEYIRASCSLKNQKATLQRLGNRNDNADESDSDDKNAGDLLKMHFWRCPTYTTSWRNELEMSLSSSEAAFLKEQIITNCQGSILAYILENNLTEVLEIDSFKGLNTIIPKFPKAIQSDYALALSFSNFMYVVRTIYNIMVSDGKNSTATVELQRLSPNMAEYSKIPIDQILEKLAVWGNPLLCKFLKQIQVSMQNGDIAAIQSCVKNREVQLKGSSRAKTMRPGEFDPNIWLGGGELDYRFYNAKAIMRDIFLAGGAEHAQSK